MRLESVDNYSTSSHHDFQRAGNLQRLVIRKRQYAKVESHEKGMEVRIRCYQKMSKARPIAR